MSRNDPRDVRSMSSIFSQRAHRVIPGGSHTYSKGDDQFPLNAPRGFVRGKGGRSWDIEGREFVDWGMGINCVLVGHAEDAIDEAAIKALRNGQNFSRPTPLEVDTAEAIVDLFPGMDMAKFAKNGSDANTAALRLARAVTGRPLVAFDADAPFLAIHNWFIGSTLMSAGVPPEETETVRAFHFNDLASVERVFVENQGKVAALIMETARDVAPTPAFADGVRDLCDRNGALLILDEVVTGFRYNLHGAYSLFGIQPDLVSIGKGMANGYALCALLGKRELMERGGLDHPYERVFLLSTTNGAEQSALAAGFATITQYRDHDVISHLAAIGQQLISGVAAAAKRHGIEEFVSAASDFACRPALKFLDADRRPSADFRTLFLQEMISHGVFMPWICPSYRHGPREVSQTLEAIDKACAIYASALEQESTRGLLNGPAAKPVFRKYN